MSSVDRDELVAYLDAELDTAAFRDGCHNGLQVWGRPSVSRLATCPSVSADFFAQASAWGADALLVHHGLFWEKDPGVVHPFLGARLKLLLNQELNLLAYHLPLDAHHRWGNNAQLASVLGLGELDWEFGRYRGLAIGVCGSLAEAGPAQSLVAKLAGALGDQAQIVVAGAATIARVGILSGGGGDIPAVLECVRFGCQALVTGNVHEQTVAVAREAGVALIAAGHYNSEKLGVRALGDHLAARYGLTVTHLDVPNPV